MRRAPGTSFRLIDRVNVDRTEVEIVSRNGSAVLMFKAEYDALVETSYPLRSPATVLLPQFRLTSIGPFLASRWPDLGQRLGIRGIPAIVGPFVGRLWAGFGPPKTAKCNSVHIVTEFGPDRAQMWARFGQDALFGA
jgi:prevent-host-death family protein